MTREEKIRQVAQKYIATDKTCGVGVRTQAFIDGAKWADGHPANPWHSIADGDLPKEPKGDLFNLTLLVRMSNGRMFPVFYDIKDGTFTDEFNESIKVGLEYWMEIPKLPTEFENEEL